MFKWDCYTGYQWINMQMNLRSSDEIYQLDIYISIIYNVIFHHNIPQLEGILMIW